MAGNGVQSQGGGNPIEQMRKTRQSFISPYRRYVRPAKAGMWVIRGLFVLIASSSAYRIAAHLDQNVYFWLIGGIAFSLIMVGIEALVIRQPISSIGAVVFGILLGILFALLLKNVIVLTLGPQRSEMIFGTEVYFDKVRGGEVVRQAVPTQIFDDALTLTLSIVLSYVGVAVMYQTRDRFNLVIPYVEFRPIEKGAKPIILDTSVIIDGRVNEVLETGVFDGPIMIPQSVLKELHAIADSPEKTRRDRGRLGLECLDRMRANALLDLRIEKLEAPANMPTDEQLIRIAQQLSARLVTNDFNLNRLANVEGIDVINLNKLANALKPVALPDETLTVKLVRRGQQPGQAIGYMDDGTMVIVENAVPQVGHEVSIVVTNTITKETGRMIFGRLQD